MLLWQQAERHYPALLQQVKDPTAPPLRMDELAELRLGLRSHLQNTPHDLAGWQLLGRLGLLLNDGETAIGALAGHMRWRRTTRRRLSIMPARWCGRG